MLRMQHCASLLLFGVVACGENTRIFTYETEHFVLTAHTELCTGTLVIVEAEDAARDRQSIAHGACGSVGARV